MEVRLLGEARPPRVDDDEPAARLLRVLDVREQMDAGDRGVDSPENDQTRVPVVGNRDPGHLAVETLRGAPRRRRADRAGEPGGAEAREESGVGRVLREISVRPAVGQRQDRLSRSAARQGRELPRDEVERLVPSCAPEPSLSFAALADSRVEDAPRPVHVLGISPHLRADVPLGDGVDAAAPDRDDAIPFDVDFEAAGVRAVERAGTRHDPGGSGSDGGFHGEAVSSDARMVSLPGDFRQSASERLLGRRGDERPERGREV